jgi:hypothetical protein
MPVLTFFGVTGPLLLAALLALSAYLDPSGAPAPADFFGIRTAQANAGVDTVGPQGSPSDYDRLKFRPVGR